MKSAAARVNVEDIAGYTSGTKVAADLRIGDVVDVLGSTIAAIIVQPDRIAVTIEGISGLGMAVRHETSYAPDAIVETY